MDTIDQVHPLRIALDQAHAEFVQAEEVFKAELARLFHPNFRVTARYCSEWDDDDLRVAREGFSVASQRWWEALRDLRAAQA